MRENLTQRDTTRAPTYPQGLGSKHFFWLFLRFLTGEGIDPRLLYESPQTYSSFFSHHRLWFWPRYLAEEGWIPFHPLFLNWGRWAEREDLRLRQELEAVRATLKDAGVPHIFLKGAIWRSSLYPFPQLRLPTDLDLYIPRASLPQAARALLSMGYLPSTTFPSEDNFEWIWEAPGRYPLDLHFALYLSHRLERPVPSPEEFDSKQQFLYLLIHFLHHKGELRWDQEADLVLYTLSRPIPPIPRDLYPAFYLLRERLRRFYGIAMLPDAPFSLSFLHRVSLRLFYSPHRAHPLGRFALLKRGILTFLLFTRVRQGLAEIKYLVRTRLLNHFREKGEGYGV